MAAALRLAMVAGEPSGDLLGGRVIAALRERLPEDMLRLEGVGGDAMQAQGLVSCYPLERLSVMGLVEPLARLPELLRLRRRLRERFLAEPPQLFLGIDAPDFNLGLARGLRRRGLRTAQLVSPSVWAWRAGRVHGVARSVDAVLCLFPFEPALYAGLPVTASHVGHPLAQELAAAPARAEVRCQLGIEAGRTVVALLPGSRESEVRQLGADLLRAGQLLRARDPRRLLLLPAANAERHAQCAALLAETGLGEGVRLLRGQSREAMIAADTVLLASGTASLEALLLDRPMVIAYRVAPMTWSIASRLARSRHVGLPNILAGGRDVVPELLQDQLTAPALALAAEELLYDSRAQRAALAPLRAAMQVDFAAALRAALAPLLPDRFRDVLAASAR
jgi:lipid-A-disaccharide synthase